ncbi:MAG: protein translocase subunit SecD [Alkaliphilus sp.]|nr:MAG: protein translocase subunit SecD [Alkaliphilus sp.]
MKAKSVIAFLAIFVVVVLAIFSSLNGIEIGGLKTDSLRDSIRQGLDLQGGVFVVYEAQTDVKGQELDRLINQTIEVFRRRVDGMGLMEPVIVREGEKRIRVELPGVKVAQDALEIIGKTAQLQFIAPDGEIIITGENVNQAEATFPPGESHPVVSLEFDSEGARKFADATEKAARLPEEEAIIYIVLDGEIISAPGVDERISGGRAIISGRFTAESAANLATLIRAGALPVDLVEMQTSTITASLGVDAFNKSVQAGKIGIILVLLFMLFYYRLPGLVASIALSAYILIVLWTLVAFNATLTLPGIAALILSVGMAVDANVIIFERLKEEMRNGKSIRASIDSGFKRALKTILDANITTLIAGFVLYYFGTGPIRGFAVTLIIGIVASMFTAIVVTKVLLKLLVNMNIFKSNKLFGA